MIRSELCSIAEMAIPTFNSHTRNGDLPFDTATLERNDSGAKSWSRYSIHEAAMMVAARQLASGQGVTWSEAARILREKPTFVHGSGADHRPNYQSHSRFHCARLEFLMVDGRDRIFVKRFQIYRGFLPDIVAAAERAVESINGRVDLASLPVAIFSMASVNLSQSWELAHSRAKQLGIPEENLIGGSFKVDPDADDWIDP